MKRKDVTQAFQPVAKTKQAEKHEAQKHRK